MENQYLYKIGGTSMSDVPTVLKAIENHQTQNSESNLNYVVSAYGAVNLKNGIVIEKGVTDLLLESKKSREAGVYTEYSNGGNYIKRLSQTLAELKKINSQFQILGLDLKLSNKQIEVTIEQSIDYLKQIDSQELDPKTRNMLAREKLASIGEVHSANNLNNILQNLGINSNFVNLSQPSNSSFSIEENIADQCKNLSNHDINVITGYTSGINGIMQSYDRGYSEVTAAHLAKELQVKRLVILKEYILSSADPKIVKNVREIKEAGFRFAAELAMIGMEAIHPEVSGMLEDAKIDLQIQNINKPDQEGTLILNTEKAFPQGPQIVTGMKNTLIINLENDKMSQKEGYLSKMTDILKQTNVLSISSDSSNITVVVDQKDFEKKPILDQLNNCFPAQEGNKISSIEKSLVLIVGSNLDYPGLMSKASNSLYQAGINIDSLSQSIKQRSIQISVARESFEEAVKVLHAGLFESEDKTQTQD